MSSTRYLLASAAAGPAGPLAHDRDPLVAGHIVAGIALGVGYGVLDRVADWRSWQRDGVIRQISFTLDHLHGAGPVSTLFAIPIDVTAIVMGLFFVFFLLRMILRNTWLAAAAFVASWAFFAAAGSTATAEFGVVIGVFLSSLFLWMTIRFGVLPCVLFFGVSLGDNCH